MTAAFEIRALAPHDLGAYKELRDAMLAAHPDAFSSDAAAERARPADSYLARLGTEGDAGGRFTLGAWRDERLVGALGCERDMRVKVKHIAHLVGMMVRPGIRRSGVGGALLDAAIQAARHADGIEMLTLSVTAGNLPAVRQYESAGFVRYGSLPRALRVGGQYHAKDLMLLML